MRRYKHPGPAQGVESTVAYLVEAVDVTIRRVVNCCRILRRGGDATSGKQVVIAITCVAYRKIQSSAYRSCQVCSLFFLNQEVPPWLWNVSSRESTLN